MLITGGVYALTERELTTSTVAALLTILGYSLYDTIIVFDRIRENVPRMPRATFSQMVNRSMSEVLIRSLVTSFSTLFPIAASDVLRRRDAAGLRLRAAGRRRVGHLLLDLHRGPGADGVEGAGAAIPPPAADRDGGSRWRRARLLRGLARQPDGERSRAQAARPRSSISHRPPSRRKGGSAVSRLGRAGRKEDGER